MKSKLTNEQIIELTKIAQNEKAGTIVNLSCFGAASKVNTRLNRIARTLPNVENMVVLREDKKFSPLTQDEKIDMIMTLFNEFWKWHLNFVNGHFEFFGLQDDFFVNDTYDRLLEYARIFFANRIDAEISGRNQFKYKFNTKTETGMLEQMSKAFPKSLYKKMKEISKNYIKRKKEQSDNVSMLQQLVANNLAWQDASSVNKK